jgi:glycosyltransferase involved in cell wall biosynthesis
MGVDDFTICIGTFGASDWVYLANERAIHSAKAQGCEVIHRHGSSLAQARNEALALVQTERVVFLDADDELAPGYLEALAVATADLRAPAVSYVKAFGSRAPCVPRVAGHDHACVADCLEHGNWLVVGTAAPTQLLLDVGGWGNEPIYEDWSLWLRCWLAGATVEAVPEAVYLAYWRRQSRNRAPGRAFRERIHREIVEANLSPARLAA